MENSKISQLLDDAREKFKEAYTQGIVDGITELKETIKDDKIDTIDGFISVCNQFINKFGDEEKVPEELKDNGMSQEGFQSFLDSMETMEFYDKLNPDISNQDIDEDDEVNDVLADLPEEDVIGGE